jgi:hypothetical protein
MRASPEVTGAKRSSRASQAARASVISSRVRATKFHHMRTGASNGSPPISRARVSARADSASSSRPSPR